MIPFNWIISNQKTCFLKYFVNITKPIGTIVHTKYPFIDTIPLRKGWFLKNSIVAKSLSLDTISLQNIHFHCNILSQGWSFCFNPKRSSWLHNITSSNHFIQDLYSIERHTHFFLFPVQDSTLQLHLVSGSCMYFSFGLNVEWCIFVGLDDL